MDGETAARIDEHRHAHFDELRRAGVDRPAMGRVAVDGERFHLMGGELLMAAAYDTLAEVYGAGAGGILREAGRDYADALLEQVDGETAAERLGQFLGLLQFLGYSAIAVDADGFTVPASPTAVGAVQRGQTGEPVCYFLAGMLAGGLAAEGRADAVRETTCRAAGGDACRFTLEG